MAKIAINAVFKINIVLICLSVLFQYNVFAQEAISIQPGEGVGVLKLDDSLESVNEKMGQIRADEMQKVRSAGDTEMWLLYQNMGQTLVYDYSTKRLKKIIVTNSALYVENTEIHVGSDTSEVIAYVIAYNNDTMLPIKTPDNEQNRTIWSYQKLGIGFWIDNQEGTVYAIEVMYREEDE
ncbi:hypothetical protein KAX97_05935 [candidate division WOR-3 bacterium]|nr:hypothetical protein [candidate division WOR-3 bacterium]